MNDIVMARGSDGYFVTHHALSHCVTRVILHTEVTSRKLARSLPLTSTKQACRLSLPPFLAGSHSGNIFRGSAKFSAGACLCERSETYLPIAGPAMLRSLSPERSTVEESHFGETGTALAVADYYIEACVLSG